MYSPEWSNKILVGLVSGVLITVSLQGHHDTFMRFIEVQTWCAFLKETYLVKGASSHFTASNLLWFLKAHDCNKTNTYSVLQIIFLLWLVIYWCNAHDIFFCCCCFVGEDSQDPYSRISKQNWNALVERIWNMTHLIRKIQFQFRLQCLLYSLRFCHVVAGF